VEISLPSPAAMAAVASAVLGPSGRGLRRMLLDADGPTVAAELCSPRGRPVRVALYRTFARGGLRLLGLGGRPGAPLALSASTSHLPLNLHLMSLPFSAGWFGRLRLAGRGRLFGRVAAAAAAAATARVQRKRAILLLRIWFRSLPFRTAGACSCTHCVLPPLFHSHMPFSHTHLSASSSPLSLSRPPLPHSLLSHTTLLICLSPPANSLHSHTPSPTPQCAWRARWAVLRWRVPRWPRRAPFGGYRRRCSNAPWACCA
jgi:hypothetical protein